ncbi:T9SS type A sorting domain-containing protein [Flavobacterium paronense]|uniref:T9SS type A sorting domain-containing protein n=1 Tax=Flavobacterium paronense TaxID=1392775 RepID=A0ABV5GCZ5_9FLAO|nr:T9SS type A sorting domain-containing protein [Flavobacterium paronense]MDN3676176.1 T9SS type A sorting domain-containing protein [Flavobacterium paronense]
MKIKLLLSLLVTANIGFAQHQINSFYNSNGFVSTAVTNPNALSHGSGGIDQTWTFAGFLSLGTSTYTNVAPTSTESSTYPGTNNVIVTSSTQGATTTEGRMFTKNTAATVSITGLNSTGLTINFNGGSNGAGNATLGAFPMVYPFTNTDNNVSGNYVYGTNSGTFSGTLTTTVDGYGVLNLPDYSYSGNVTRLKTVLSVTLYLSIFPVGTASQTTYAYYEPTDPTNNFKLRSLNTVVVASAAGINQNDTTIEIGTMPVLGNAHNTLESVWVKNPVETTIEINTSSTIDNATISVTDMLGKTIYQAKNETINGTFEIPVSLTKGIYLITIESESRSIKKKIVKS